MAELTGSALVLDEALNLWVGLDPETGRISEGRHPQSGEVISGRVLVLPGTRGGSSGSGVLAETGRAGSQPLAVVLPKPDMQVVIAAMLLGELYGGSLPVAVVDREQYDAIRSGDAVTVSDDGAVRVERADG